MSAYIVNEDDIKLVAVFAVTDSQREFKTDEATRIANVLYAENHRSVNHRYNEKDETPELTVSNEDFVKFEQRETFSLAQVAMSAHCIEYQSCECSDYRESKAYEILRDVYDRVSFSMADATDGVTWGIRS